MRWKVVNRHGQKPTGSLGYKTADEADHAAHALNARGFDDGPFTVWEWGYQAGWFGIEGHEEALRERDGSTW